MTLSAGWYKVRSRYGGRFAHHTGINWLRYEMERAALPSEKGSGFRRGFRYGPCERRQPSEDHRTRIVFITRDIDKEAIDDTCVSLNVVAAENSPPHRTVD